MLRVMHCPWEAGPGRHCKLLSGEVTQIAALKDSFCVPWATSHHVGHFMSLGPARKEAIAFVMKGPGYANAFQKDSFHFALKFRGKKKI